MVGSITSLPEASLLLLVPTSTAPTQIKCAKNSLRYRQPGYAVSLSRRWLIEKSFGWLKQTGPLRQTKLRGLSKVDWLFVFSCAAHNLLRLPRMIAQQHRPVKTEQCA
jgi:hypothetical protein